MFLELHVPPGLGFTTQTSIFSESGELEFSIGFDLIEDFESCTGDTITLDEVKKLVQSENCTNKETVAGILKHLDM